MYALNSHAALHQHVARDWRIYAARKQKRRASARAQRHSARAHVAVNVHVRFVAYLYVQLVLGMMYVYRQARYMLQYIVPYLAPDLHRIQRKTLVAAARLDLERARAAFHQLFRLSIDLVHVLVQLPRGRNRVYAEYAAYALDAVLHVGHTGNEYTAVHHSDLRADRLYRRADVGDERVEKVVAVVPLQKYLAKTYKQKLSHLIISF